MSIELCRIRLQSDYKFQQTKESCRVCGQFVHCPVFVSEQKSAMTAIMTKADFLQKWTNCPLLPRWTMLFYSSTGL